MIFETCININKPGYSQQIKNAFSQLLPNGQLKIANTPNYPTTSYYQPGGIAGGFDGSLRTRYLREGADQCGRWAWQEFGDSTSNLRVYTMYRVNGGSLRQCGSTTAWAQQQLYFSKKNIEYNPRQQVIDNFIKEVQPLIHKGYNTAKENVAINTHLTKCELNATLGLFYR